MAEIVGFERIDKFNENLKLIIDNFDGYQSYIVIELMINAMKSTLLPLIVGQERFRSNEKVYYDYAKSDYSKDPWLYLKAKRQSGTSTAVEMVLAALMTIADPSDTSFCIIYGTCLQRATFFKEQVLALIPSHLQSLVTLEAAVATEENIKPCLISIVEDYELLPKAKEFWYTMTDCRREFPASYPFLIANTAPGPLRHFILSCPKDINYACENTMDLARVCESHRKKGQQEFCRCNLEPDMIAPWKNTPSALVQRQGFLRDFFCGNFVESENLVDCTG